MSTSSLGIVIEPGGLRPPSSMRLPAGPVERQRPVRPRARRAGGPDARGCRWPSPGSCRHRRGSASERFPGVGASLRLASRAREDPTVPDRGQPLVPGRRASDRRADASRQGVGRADRAGRAVGGRQRDLEQRRRRAGSGSVRLWLVRTAIAIRSRRQPADDGARAEEPAGMAERRRPSNRDRLDAEAVRDRRREPAVRATSASIVARDVGGRGRRRRTAPGPSGRGRSAVRRDRARRAGRGHDRGERRDRRCRRDRSIGGSCGARAGEPVAVGERAARRLGGLVERVRRARAGRGTASRSWSATGAPPTASASMPEDQVVRVRVVPRRARAGVRLADVAERSRSRPTSGPAG